MLATSQTARRNSVVWKDSMGTTTRTGWIGTWLIRPGS